MVRRSPHEPTGRSPWALLQFLPFAFCLRVSIADRSLDRRAVFNVPNQLTPSIRFVLAVILFVLIAYGNFLSGMWVFLVAAGTDWLDGYWARKYNQVTTLGRILDPFVDKIIICGIAFIFLAADSTIRVDRRRWRSLLLAGSCWLPRCEVFWSSRAPTSARRFQAS